MCDLSVSPPQVQAIKLLVRWLLGMKNNQSKSANSTLRLLSAMLVSEGDLTEQKKIRYVEVRGQPCWSQRETSGSGVEG